MKAENCKVCVTGGAGYIGSWLVKELLTRGYIVHTTLRNLNDESKVGLLKSFPYAETRLVMFQADIFDPNTFEPAIQGCQFVLHVATPVTTSYDFQWKNMIEATIRAAKRIKMFCVRSGTVKRLIYTGSVVAASPLKDDGTGFKDTMDETCWTPLNLSFSYSNDDLKGYMESKLLTEKEILNCENCNCGELEVVSLVLGLVGGDSVLPRTPSTVSVCISQLENKEPLYQPLRFLEELLGKLPLIHIGDVSEAFIFCMEQPSITGRFLCASLYVSSAEIADYYRQSYPELLVKQEYSNIPKREINWGSMKLLDQGFKYKYDMKMTLDDCIRCARRNNDLKF